MTQVATYKILGIRGPFFIENELRRLVDASEIVKVKRSMYTLLKG